jgi:hypothetical protein
VGGLIYFQMSAVAAVIYETARGFGEGHPTGSQRRLALVKRTLWFAILPLGVFWVLLRDSRT